ncbi:hypothetical protein FNV60_28835 [Streptomyces sp. RLB3-5]|uniref:hypothetical protein n=1 Tax=unclassified Streptomyces TaxID=2593676 RepID=UPI0011651EEC|nr:MULTISPECIES: hypothetical protein [unclassified Streptomyces]QDO51709.1 hypothetical protein FNV60_28835 [Streptomyces sp. RLB3-5]QDO61951.1 hypothetical protein FNV59_31080 [Streptomyces sp. RLB1-8]
MSSLAPALLGIFVIAALMISLFGFRLAVDDGAPVRMALLPAGSGFVGTLLNIGAVAAALGLPDETPAVARIGWVGFGVVCAAAAAVAAYNATGGTNFSTGAPYLSRSKRWYTAGGAFTAITTLVGLAAYFGLLG